MFVVVLQQSYTARRCEKQLESSTYIWIHLHGNIYVTTWGTSRIAWGHNSLNRGTLNTSSALLSHAIIIYALCIIYLCISSMSMICGPLKCQLPPFCCTEIYSFSPAAQVATLFNYSPTREQHRATLNQILYTISSLISQQLCHISQSTLKGCSIPLTKYNNKLKSGPS